MQFHFFTVNSDFNVVIILIYNNKYVGVFYNINSNNEKLEGNLCHLLL